MFQIAVTAGLAIALLHLSRIDARTYRLPDRYTLPLIAAGWAVNAIMTQAVPWDAVAAAAVGYLSFALIGEVFFRWRGVEGLGLGDAKLLAAAGAWVGLRALPLVVLIAAVAGLIYVLVARRQVTGRIAFGPWLASAFLGVWIATRLVPIG